MQTSGHCSILSDMFSLGLVMCAIFNNGKPLIQANNNPMLYMKQIECVSIVSIIVLIHCHQRIWSLTLDSLRDRTPYSKRIKTLQHGSETRFCVAGICHWAHTNCASNTSPSQAHDAASMLIDFLHMSMGCLARFLFELVGSVNVTISLWSYSRMCGRDQSRSTTKLINCLRHSIFNRHHIDFWT